MESCGECEFDWEADAAALPELVASIGPDIERTVSEAIASADRSAALGRRPAPGVWSPLEYLGHLRDVLAFFDDRIERVLVEHGPVLTVEATFAELAEQRAYGDEDPAEVVAEIGRRAEIASRRLAALDPAQWSRVGIGSSGDERTVLVLARRLAHEGTHHGLDIARQLARPC